MVFATAPVLHTRRFNLTLFTSGFGGTSIALMLFAFRKTVVTLVVWAGEPFYSNCNPLLFLNMSTVQSIGTDCQITVNEHLC